jgi:hypothetical protein
VIGGVTVGGVKVTLSNTQLPHDTDGKTLETGELQIFDNHERDGYWYLYESNWGCCRQVNCCTNNPARAWPDNGCWECCPEQVGSACTYALNHTVTAYRTRDFKKWHNLGELVRPSDRNPGILFVPRVVFSAVDKRYVMWFENYNQTAPPVPGVPMKGHYSIAVSTSASGPFKVIKDGPHASATFNCSDTQGDFDLFTDEDGTSYIIVTHYTFFCIERLDAHALAGTGETAKIVAMDPLIKEKGHPNGDEAPTMFRRGELYYVTYASGCCGCKGGSIIWAHVASHPLGPWKSIGNLTPHGPVTRAQQRAVFSVPTPEGGKQYVHLGNQWVPGQGGEGTCTNGGLLYWWPLSFTSNGSIAEIKWKDEVSFEMAAAQEMAAAHETAARPVLHTWSAPYPDCFPGQSFGPGYISFDHCQGAPGNFACADSSCNNGSAAFCTGGHSHSGCTCSDCSLSSTTPPPPSEAYNCSCVSSCQCVLATPPPPPAPTPPHKGCYSKCGTAIKTCCENINAHHPTKEVCEEGCDGCCAWNGTATL